MNTNEKILQSHIQEDEYNKEIGLIDKQIKQLSKKKKSLAIKISKNMKHRNILIDKLKK